MQDLQTGDVAETHGLTVRRDRKAVTVCQVLQRYAHDGYPDRRGSARAPGRHLDCETKAVETLLKYFTRETVQKLSQNTLDHYHDWRVKSVTKGDGHRTTDLELNALTNALNWSVRKELIQVNPISSRMHYHSSTDARHCKDVAPTSTDELHEIAAPLFQSRRRESLGWQALFEASTGLRTSEALALKLDAPANEPGWITEDGGSMCVRRCKKASRENPFVQIHEGLKILLAAHLLWHKQRFPNSPWYFPGNSGLEKITGGALTHALGDLFKSGKIQRKITSHGLRAFFVLVRRSHGISDTQIAWEINHIGGVATLERSYGGVPPHWRDGKGPKLSWSPKGDPAWTNIKPLD